MTIHRMYFSFSAGFSTCVFICFLLVSCSEKPPLGLHDEVNPFIGTGGHGHTYPGATAPFGMVQLSPDTRLTGWDGCGGYHYSDTAIYGFSHTHLQGTGVSDYGDILFMPCTQFKANSDSWPERYKSKFSHDSEKASAGFYAVDLIDHGIHVELTTTPRVGIHRYRLEQPDTLTLVVDMNHRDELVHYSIYPLDDTTLVGHRVSDNWAREQHVYFAARFDRPFEWRDQLTEMSDLGFDDTGKLLKEVEYVPVFACDFGVIDELNSRVGLSFVSIEGALQNLEFETPVSDFDYYKDQAADAWDEQLSTAVAEGGSDDERKKFYTALYHCFTTPNVASDVDGQYRGTDLSVHQLAQDDGLHYTVFSLWDTYRALHPLLNWLEPVRSRDFIRTMLRMYKQGGQLPVWELAANYTGCMIGYHSVPVIADAKTWGIGGFNQSLALEAMVQAADSLHLGLPAYKANGYISLDEEHESVSKTLEYAFDDACIASFAKSIASSQEEEVARDIIEISSIFQNRALSYRNLFNVETGFIQPKKGGAWLANFEPREVNFNYTEANGWQYNFYVPHDISGHIQLLGGPENYEALLDAMFQSTSETTGRSQPDITGMIGQYAHGNEPSHHMAYLYAYTGNHAKTVDLVTQIQESLYRNAPDGLSGNEDCGQMSAWHVWSALGMYPVCPGSDQLVAGIPSFNSIRVTPRGTANGTALRSPLVINRYGSGSSLASIHSSFSEAKPISDHVTSWFSKKSVMRGGKIQFNMDHEANGIFGQDEGSRPFESWLDQGFVGVPIIDAPMTYRSETIEVRLLPNPKMDQIEYQLTDELSNYLENDWLTYTTPITLDGSVKIWARSAASNGSYSSPVVHKVSRISHDWSLNLQTEFDPQYAASGPNALIDGIRGVNHYQNGDWQGFWGEDVTGVIDLRKKQTILSIQVGALRDIRPWIFLPRAIQVETSLDSIDWHIFGEGLATHDESNDNKEALVHRFQIGGAAFAQYVRFTVLNFGALPRKHLGAGNPSWVFLDEIEVVTK